MVIRRRVWFALGWAIMAVLLACSDPERHAATHRTPTTTAETRAAIATTETPPARGTPVPTPQVLAPKFEQGQCPFRPLLDAAVQSVVCGTVSVPEDHGTPSSKTIQLAVAVFRSVSPKPGVPPLVWLDGGPGSGSLDGTGNALGGSIARALLADRDLILFDQRGTGFSRPSLACPEVAQTKYELWKRQVSTAEEDEIALRALLACRARLAGEGINLAAYTSAQNAADVNAIRAALGYPQVSLYGISYGTRLALTVLRDFPGIVHSVVLDSAVPVQANLYTEVYVNAQRAFDTLLAGCAANTACNTTYPNLGNLLTTTMQRLDASPPTVQLRRSRTGERYDLVLTGDRFASALFQALYATRLIPAIPAIISATHAGDYEPFVSAIGDLLLRDSVAWGMYYSVQCGEELRFVTRAEVAAAKASVRPEIAASLGGETLFAVCAAWGAKEAAPVENTPVTSAVPALVLAGEYDPVAPPAWGRIVAATLRNSTFVEFPGTGHGALFAGSCPLSITAAFLRDPATTPDTACASTMLGPRWILRLR